MKQKGNWIAGTTLCLLLVAFVTSVYLLQPVKDVPELSLQAIDGQTINLAGLKGVPTLVTFWATSCSTCMQEMPHLIDLYHELNADGFEIIAIAMAYDPPNRVVQLARDRSLPYPVILDIKGNAARAFGDISVTPTSILVGPDGKILKTLKGKIDFESLRQQIRQMQFA